MKKINWILFLSILITLYSCNPMVSTKISKSYPSTDFKQEIIVLNLDDQIPENTEELGMIKIGDTGFTLNCGFDIVMNLAKLEARKAGGNAIKIIEHRPPTIMGSACHRIKAKVLKVENIEQLALNAEKEELLDIDYAIINVYRYSGVGSLINYDLHLGDSVICRVKNNFKTTIHITKDGLNTLWAKTEAKAEIPIDVVIGKEYFVKCSVGMGAFVGRPKIELIDSKTGRTEFGLFKAKKQ